jgi:hypothetical protein
VREHRNVLASQEEGDEEFLEIALQPELIVSDEPDFTWLCEFQKIFLSCAPRLLEKLSWRRGKAKEKQCENGNLLIETRKKWKTREYFLVRFASDVTFSVLLNLLGVVSLFAAPFAD